MEIAFLPDKITTDTVLGRAMALRREKEGEWLWPNIPEKYWEQAVGGIISSC